MEIRPNRVIYKGLLLIGILFSRLVLENSLLMPFPGQRIGMIVMLCVVHCRISLENGRLFLFKFLLSLQSELSFLLLESLFFDLLILHHKSLVLIVRVIRIEHFLELLTLLIVFRLLL